MFVGQNLTDYFFSLGGAIFGMVMFVLALFGADFLGWLADRGAKKAGIKYQLFAGKDDEGNCPL